MKFFKTHWPKLTWAIGLTLFFLGEGVSAFNFMCAVLAHWVWQMPTKIVVENLNIEADKVAAPASVYDPGFWGGK